VLAKLRFPLLLVLALGAMAFPACSSGGEELVIYSGRTENLIKPLLEQFAEETGIDIAVRYDDSANLALLLAEEGGDSRADVFLSQSPGATGFLDQEGLLAELPADVLSAVPDQDESADGRWVGLSGRVRTLVYNTDAFDEDELPDSVLDLVDPKFKGKIGVAPSNGSFQDFVTVLRERYGDAKALAFLKGLHANDARPYPNNLSIVEAVGRGEVQLGLVNHYYLFRVKADDADVAAANHFFEAGDVGSTLLVTTASILKSSNHEDEARRLVEFLLQAEAQRYFAKETFEYPLAAGVQPTAGVPPLASLPVTRVDLTKLGGGLERTAKLIDESGLDNG
jgi:iron(III) transport system substrate-binding protein